MQKRPKSAIGAVIKKVIHHQIGVRSSQISETLSVIHASGRLFWTNGTRSSSGGVSSLTVVLDTSDMTKVGVRFRAFIRGQADAHPPGDRRHARDRDDAGATIRRSDPRQACADSDCESARDTMCGY